MRRKRGENKDNKIRRLELEIARLKSVIKFASDPAFTVRDKSLFINLQGLEIVTYNNQMKIKRLYDVVSKEYKSI